MDVFSMLIPDYIISHQKVEAASFSQTRWSLGEDVIQRLCLINYLYQYLQSQKYHLLSEGYFQVVHH